MSCHVIITSVIKGRKRGEEDLSYIDFVIYAGIIEVSLFFFN